jgi:hypothetical protein
VLRGPVFGCLTCNGKKVGEFGFVQLHLGKQLGGKNATWCTIANAFTIVPEYYVQVLKFIE